MNCPHYNPQEETCGLKSQYFGKLSKETTSNHCEYYFTSCSIYTEDFVQRAPEAMRELEKKIEQIEESQKITPKFLRQEVRGSSIEQSVYEGMR